MKSMAWASHSHHGACSAAALLSPQHRVLYLWAHTLSPLACAHREMLHNNTIYAKMPFMFLLFFSLLLRTLDQHYYFNYKSFIRIALVHFQNWQRQKYERKKTATDILIYQEQDMKDHAWHVENAEAHMCVANAVIHVMRSGRTRRAHVRYWSPYFFDNERTHRVCWDGNYWISHQLLVNVCGWCKCWKYGRQCDSSSSSSSSNQLASSVSNRSSKIARQMKNNWVVYFRTFYSRIRI